MGYNPETVKTVLNVIQKEFESEENRNKHIVSKVQIMLTVAGILLTAIIFLLKTVFEQDWYKCLNASLLLLAMFVIIVAILLFLNVIRVKTFQRIGYEKLVFNTELEKEPTEVESRLISTYEEALKMNIRVVDELVDTFKKGTFLIGVSVYMLSVVLFVILIIHLKN
ncbi:MAG: hypothetical protein FJ264_01105 [Planctomycetes bacterium]|nr:hypothetical protein [Planctomycetota bacterium]